MRIKVHYLVIIILLVLLAGQIFSRVKTKTPADYSHISRLAVIKPDYTNTTVPPNIAPLNFVVQENATRYLVRIYCADEKRTIAISSRTGKIQIPLRKWKKLLEDNRGNKLIFDIFIQDDNRRWKRFERIENTIAEENIDSHLVYRFMKPIYNWWYSIGIYQRNLENFDKSEVLHGKSFGNGCINCHTFLNNKPEKMTIGVRSTAYGSSTLLSIDGEVNKIGTKWGYTTWHPSGTLAVYSLNKVRQFFHKTRSEQRDVVDLDSALVQYTIDTQKIKKIPALAQKDRLETYPTWSPDGKYLYFCSAPILWEDRNSIPPVNYDKVRYDLMRISYDLQTDQWGQVETVLSSEETQKSILLPRITPDGRFMVFSMCDYGCFPVYSADSDLFMMDLQKGEYKKMPVNSEYSESWHSFSSNSRWMAFSSKRRGGLFTRTYFCYMDKSGRVHKSFILPQKDPTDYDSLMQTYSVPELITGPVKVSKKAMARAIRSSEQIEVDMPLTGATPKMESSEPWRQERE